MSVIEGPFRDPGPGETLPVVECRSCGKAMIWTRYAKTGNRLPVDRDPPEGMAPNLRIRVAAGGALVSFFHKPAPGQAVDGLILGVSHHAACRHGHAWRRPRS